MKQKTDYIHLNPCKSGLVKLPEDYVHSSAKYYFTGVQGIYPVMTFSLRRMSPLNNKPTQKSTPSRCPEKKQGVPRRVSRQLTRRFPQKDRM